MFKFKGVGDAIEGLLLAYTTIHSLLDKAPEGLKEKLPMFLGLSHEDERRWADIWTYLTPEEQTVITNFLESLEKYERNSFRYILVGMPDHEITEKSEEKKDGEKKDGGSKPKTKITKQSRAPIFLQGLVETIKKNGNDMKEAKRQCLMGNIINADAISVKIAKKWHESLEWLKNHDHEVIAFAKKQYESLDAQCGKLDASLKKRIYQLNSRGKVKKDKKGRPMIKPEFKYKGFWASAFPTKRMRYAFKVLLAVVAVLFIHGIINW